MESLRLNWSGFFNGIRDNGIGRPKRAGGLSFFNNARLPSLKTLTIDFQYSTFVPFQDEDLESLFGATLPRIEHLTLLRCDHPDQLVTCLVSAAFANQLKELNLEGNVFTDEGITTLLDHQAVFASLKKVMVDSWCWDEVSPQLWKAFVDAFPGVVEE